MPMPRAGRWARAIPATVLDFDARFGIDPFADPRVGLIHTGTHGSDRSERQDRRLHRSSRLDRRRRGRAAASRSNHRRRTLFARLDFELSKAAVAVCGNRVAGFSGLEDLAIVLIIVGAGAWLLQRLARKIFAEQI